MEFRFPLYQRLIEIQPIPANLLSFADYLLIFGPDWEEQAVQIRNDVQSDRLSDAALVASSVHIDKYLTFETEFDAYLHPAFRGDLPLHIMSRLSTSPRICMKRKILSFVTNLSFL